VEDRRNEKALGRGCREIRTKDELHSEAASLKRCLSCATKKKIFKKKGLLHAEKPGPKTSFVLKVAHVCVHIKRNRRRKREMFDEKVGMRHRREIWAIQLHVQEVSSKSVSYVFPKTKQNRKHNVEGLQGNQGRPSYILK